MSSCRFALMTLAVAALAGCSLLDSHAPAPTDTSLTASLGIAPQAVSPSSVPPADWPSLRQGYTTLLTQLDDPRLRQQLALRLADVHMLLAEQQLAAGELTAAQATFRLAQQVYQQVLLQYPQEPTRADMLYQLSRAQAMTGQLQDSMRTLDAMVRVQPDAKEAAEARFRLAELFYSRADYTAAASAYQAVLDLPGSSPRLREMAAYMLGWAWLKQGQAEKALQAFDRVLQQNLQDLPAPPLLTALSPGSAELVKDTLRVMAAMFAEQGNGAGITAFYHFYGAQSHAYLLYDELAQQYLDADKFALAAEVYLAFVTAQPLHEAALTFYVKHIDALLLGDMPRDAITAKQDFIALYGMRGWYPQLSLLQREQLRPYLHQYLQDVAASYFHLAQQLAPTLPVAAAHAYTQAEQGYREFIDFFVDDALVPQMQWQLAHTLAAQQRVEEAQALFTQLAYATPAWLRQADAAYQALLLYAAVDAPSAEQRAAQRDSRERFVQHFPGDARAINVAAVLMQDAFAAEHLDSALQHSLWLQSRNDSVLPDDIKLAALQVSAHCYFTRGEYALAQRDYALISQRLPEDQAVTHNLAVSLYRHAEDALMRNEPGLALTLLRDFPQRFATHPLAGDALWQLAHLHLAEQDVAAALPAFRQYAHNYPEPFTRVMQARWQMSEFYQQSQEPQKRAYWLRKLVAGQRDAGAAGTDDTLWMASYAALALAEDAQQSFSAIVLRPPLATRLQQKQQALDVAVNYYQQVLEFALREHVTQASHALGQLYLQLADDLLASTRPAGLDALALEQYEVLLMEQAFPFEQQGLTLLARNAERSWQGINDTHVQQSFVLLAARWPLRYAKTERIEPADEATEALRTALLARQQGQFEAAQAQYQALLQQQPEHPLVQRNAAIFYDLYRGEHALALGYYQQYAATLASLAQGHPLREEMTQAQRWISDLQRQLATRATPTRSSP